MLLVIFPHEIGEKKEPFSHWDWGRDRIEPDFGIPTQLRQNRTFPWYTHTV